MRVIYHAEAEADLIEAAKFYSQRDRSLGIRFLDAVDQAVHSILPSPATWPIVEGDVRRREVKGFPYSLLYRAIGDELRIIATKHHSRDDDYWKHRIGGD